MKILRIIVPILFLVSCSKSVQLINKGNYDKAIDVLVESLKENPANHKDLEAFNFAMHEANKKDIESIKALKMSGKPNIWNPVLNLYLSLENRQQKALTLPLAALDHLKFEAVNYDTFISESRQNACLYYYAEAMKLLETGTAVNRQLAYQDLVMVQKLIPGFRDVDEMLEKYEAEKPIDVFYQIRNEYDGYLPWRLEEELVYLDLTSFNSPKYRFLNDERQAQNFRYKAVILVKDIKILPENTEELYYTETARIQDGIAYLLNESGGFEHDSAGNKIEMPKFKTVACYVTETRQKKSIFIGGQVQITEVATGRVFSGNSVTGESAFEHRSVKFKGDLDALSPETLELIGSKELEYPSDLEMILRASDKFKINAVNEMIEMLEKINGNVTKKE